MDTEVLEAAMPVRRIRNRFRQTVPIPSVWFRWWCPALSAFLRGPVLPALPAPGEVIAIEMADFRVMVPAGIDEAHLVRVLRGVRSAS